MITRTLIPGACGIGDYTLKLARALSSFSVEVALFGGRVTADPRAREIGDEWDARTLSSALDLLREFAPNLVVLQYTPLMYAEHGQAEALERFWESCGRQWRTALTLHETYFRVWRYPPSWIRGANEKRRMRRLIQRTHHVVTASQPLVDEVRRWGLAVDARYIPVGSAFDVSLGDRELWRTANGITKGDVVLALFGGGTSLRWLRRHVDEVDRVARARGLPVRWLLLGGAPREWFHLESPVHDPGRVSEEALSCWLQASDIFLMPHYAGVCGKRSTLMAAMQHRLPVVGTRTDTTDAFWDTAAGVTLTERDARAEFAAAVIRLVSDANLRVRSGDENRRFFDQYFAWDRIARSFVELANNS